MSAREKKRQQLLARLATGVMMAAPIAAGAFVHEGPADAAPMLIAAAQEARGEAEAKPKGEAEARGEAEAKGEAEARKKKRRHKKARGEAEAKGEGEAEAHHGRHHKAKGEAEAKGEGEAEARAEGEAEAKGEGEAEARAEGEAEGEGEAEARRSPDEITRPSGVAPYRGDRAELVSYGEKLFADTSLSTNGLACTSCHTDFMGYNDTFKQPYPHYVQMGKDVFGLDRITAEQMVQICMLIPMENKILPWDSKELAALAAYVEELQKEYAKR